VNSNRTAAVRRQVVRSLRVFTRLKFTAKHAVQANLRGCVKNIVYRFEKKEETIGEKKILRVLLVGTTATTVNMLCYAYKCIIGCTVHSSADA
jgi:hypothetical protein